MYIYQLLTTFLPKPVATIITTLILATVIVLTAFFSFDANLSFKYGDL